MIKISIVVPVYNDELYIEECLLSVINQKYENLEIICVNDCSTDESVTVIEKIATTDSRIKMLSLEKNMGAYVARKYGVNASTGDYIMFLDADDTIDDELVNELQEQLSIKDVDILQFSSNIVNSGVDNTIIEDMRNFVEPLCEIIYKSDILTKCFCDYKYGYNLWNKVYRADLCKKVFSHLPDLNIQKANDIFIYFFIAANAFSYRGIVSHNKYNYFYGRGNTGEREITAKEYQKYCKYSEMLREMQNNVSICPNIIVAKSALEKLKFRLLEESISVWIFSVKNEDKGKALEALFSSWDILDILDRYFMLFRGQSNILAEYINGFSCMMTKITDKCKIAIYYCQNKKTGMEKILAQLISQLLHEGYELIFIVDEINLFENCELMNLVKKYSIPSTYDVRKGKIIYKNRLKELSSILSAEKVDVVCYIGTFDETTLYDIIAIKCMGIRIAMIKQHFFPQDVIGCQGLISFQKKVFNLVDVLLVFSKEETYFWKTFGVNSYNIEDSLVWTSNNEIEYNLESKNIIWIGKIDKDQGQYHDIVPIMAHVVKKIPDCVLNIYGNFNALSDLYYFEQQIYNYNLTQNIIYRGEYTETTDIYANAGILLVTSAFELFPLNIYQCKQLGIPIVTYDMPYLELLNSTTGHISVMQRDTLAAATAIIELLENKEMRRKMSIDAKTSIHNYTTGNIENFISGLLFNTEQADIVFEEERSSYRNILEVLLIQYSEKSKKYDELFQKFNSLKEKCKIEHIRKLSKENKVKIAIYPYGVQGKRIEQLMNCNNIKIDLIIDNNVSVENCKIISTSDLAKIDVKKYLFIICSDNIIYYKDIRKTIYHIVPRDNIFDWYPLDELF